VWPQPWSNAESWLKMSGSIRQIAAVTTMGLRAIPDRVGTSLVIVIGMALVVAVTVSILSMSVGFMRTVHNTGREDRAILLSHDSQYEFASAISRENTLSIADLPGIKLASDGKPIVSAEYLVAVLVAKKSDGLDAYVTLRGVGPKATALRPEIKLVSGRMFAPARHELIVGKSALAQFEGLEVGAQVPMPESDWTITGSFESNGDEHESELLADSETLLSAMRANTFHSVTVMLNSPESLQQFQAAITANPTLAVDATRETQFVADQSQYLNAFLTLIAYVVGGIMGLGATFGALNTMYTAISARAIEIATLRAIGFSGTAVVVSVLAESSLLAVSGAAIGALVAWVGFNGNLHAVGGLVFRLAVSPSLVAIGIGFAFTLGLIGGVFPAIRAARLPIADAFK
jgi:putative ABC transport system permease protein